MGFAAVRSALDLSFFTADEGLFADRDSDLGGSRAAAGVAEFRIAEPPPYFFPNARI